VTIRVVVADDQALVRVGFHGIIAATPGFAVVGEAATGAEAVEAARTARPDVILMDIRMPGMDGIEATRQITGAAGTRDVRVLILTTFDLDEYVYAALRAGASGFLLKDTMPADLLQAIRVIAAGDALLAPSVTRRLLGEFARRPDAGAEPEAGAAVTTVADVTGVTDAASDPGVVDVASGAGVVGVTDREREVLTLVAQGLSNSEIATELVISPATAKTHVAHLLTKLGCRDRVQLVIFAYRAGLVPAI
jgi:DNA-binding NarL/FixJ family response regulator